MILIERTYWPLVVVGSVPDEDGASAAPVDPATLATADRLWVVLIVGGLGTRARAAQDALIDWLSEHGPVLSARVVRCAWVIEDDTLRACADMWQALLGRTLFDVEAATFRTFRPALRWLTERAS